MIWLLLLHFHPIQVGFIGDALVGCFPVHPPLDSCAVQQSRGRALIKLLGCGVGAQQYHFFSENSQVGDGTLKSDFKIKPTFESQLLYFQVSCVLIQSSCLLIYEMGLKPILEDYCKESNFSLGPCTHNGRPERGSWFWISSVPAITPIWGSEPAYRTSFSLSVNLPFQCKRVNLKQIGTLFSTVVALICIPSDGMSMSFAHIHSSVHYCLCFGF